MAVRKLVERTIYVATCPVCGGKRTLTENPPRESLCTCGTWIKYEPVSYVGPDTFGRPNG